MAVQTTQTMQIPRMIARLTPSARRRHARLKDLAYSANPIELYQALTSKEETDTTYVATIYRAYREALDYLFPPKDSSQRIISVEELDKINAGIRYKALMEVLMGQLYARRNSTMYNFARKNYTEGVPKEEIFAACFMAWLPIRDMRKPIIYSDDRTIEDKFVLRPAIAACASGCYNKKIKNGDEITLILQNKADVTLPVVIETENPNIEYKMGRRLSEDFVIRMHHATLERSLLTTALERPQAGEIRRIQEAYRIAELAPYIYGQSPEPGQPQVRPTRQHRHLRHGRRTHR